MERFMVITEYQNHKVEFESDFEKADNRAYALSLCFGCQSVVVDTTDCVPLTIWSRQ